MVKQANLQKLKERKRHWELPVEGDEDLGPLSQLPGEWKNEPSLSGRGWNLIALPFAARDGQPNYRVLMNQYNESLVFNLVDKAVPNRGITDGETVSESDQLLVTLDYVQKISQVAAADSPNSGKAGDPGLAIHHEPGLWLHMLNKRTADLDVGRLATVPHGDSVLALGKSQVIDGPPEIPTNVTALPLGGVEHDIENNDYLAPYKHFVDNPFVGVVSAAGFPGFNPLNTTELLRAANSDVDIVKTTVLDVDTDVESAGIVNIPFIVKQANATKMHSTFWIQELAKKDANGFPILRLQYLQVVMLDFFDRPDGEPGLIRWPHISINTMQKTMS